MTQELKYWFNQKTRQVETGPKSLAVNRLGPFESFEEAARAEKVILSGLAAFVRRYQAMGRGLEALLLGREVSAGNISLVLTCSFP